LPTPVSPWRRTVEVPVADAFFTISKRRIIRVEPPTINVEPARRRSTARRRETSSLRRISFSAFPMTSLM